MDLINQNKFKNTLIILLLVFNINSISIIWMQILKDDEPEVKAAPQVKNESVQLMKKALDLSPEQKDKIEKIRINPMQEAKKYNDRMDLLKKQLAEELFKENPDTDLATSHSREIGDLQSKIELIRFKHFKELIAVCSPEQKEKLKPIINEVFTKKPPKVNLRTGPADKPSHDLNREIVKPENNGNVAGDKKTGDALQNDFAQYLTQNKPEPPSVEEKLGRLVRKLSLTNDQTVEIKKILIQTSAKDKELRERINPDRDEIDREKEKNRKDEENKILKILDKNQRTLYMETLLRKKR